jgi:murein DD-endopeptidase MepM/ murein hydrolase activator NlpD
MITCRSSGGRKLELVVFISGAKRAAVFAGFAEGAESRLARVGILVLQDARLYRMLRDSKSPARKLRATFLHGNIPAIFIVILGWLALPAAAATWSVRSAPAGLVNGGPVLFRVKTTARVVSLSGKWLGHEFPFSYDRTSKSWFALAGVSFETLPGQYALELSGQRKAGERVTFTQRFAIRAGKYPKIRAQLTVQGKFTEPSPEQLKQIDADQKVKEDYLSRVTPDREWDGNFVAPAHAEVSDVYGSQRIFNGKAQRPHYGLDFRVPTGTPVTAMNKGTVLLARPLYFEGNFVVIDHGQGLLTLYLHLSQIKVKEGESVTRGQEIGLSGGTGRATGPHLHVAVRWQGTYLDPERLMQLTLP